MSSVSTESPTVSLSNFSNDFSESIAQTKAIIRLSRVVSWIFFGGGGGGGLTEYIYFQSGNGNMEKTLTKQKKEINGNKKKN